MKLLFNVIFMSTVPGCSQDSLKVEVGDEVGSLGAIQQSIIVSGHIKPYVNAIQIILNKN
jgi:hypothetical protein